MFTSVVKLLLKTNIENKDFEYYETLDKVAGLLKNEKQAKDLLKQLQ